MHHLVIEAVLDGDMCIRLENIEYSTTPRKFITIEDMLEYRANVERMERRVLEVMGA